MKSPVFCDWITFVVPFVHPESELIHGGRRIDEDEKGRENWSTYKRVNIKGSYDSNIQVKSLDFLSELSPHDTSRAAVERYDRMLPATVVESVLRKSRWTKADSESLFLVEISGNPTKFMQGQNIWGTKIDMMAICQTMACEIFDKLGLKPSARDLIRWSLGYFYIKRVDITTNMQLDSQKDVTTFLKNLYKTATTRIGGAEWFNQNGTTVYFGKGSRYKGVKFYDKYAEQVAHLKLEDYPDTKEKLFAACNGLVRFEVVVRSEMIRQKGLRWADAWEDYDFGEFIVEELGKIKFGDHGLNQEKIQELLDDLPTHLCATLAKWMNGSSGPQLRDMIGKRTYYRHRALLLQYRVNIGAPYDSDEAKKKGTKVVNMVRVLEAKQCLAPDWLYEQGMMHQWEKPKLLQDFENGTHLGKVA